MTSKTGKGKNRKPSLTVPKTPEFNSLKSPLKPKYANQDEDYKREPGSDQTPQDFIEGAEASKSAAKASKSAAQVQDADLPLKPQCDDPSVRAELDAIKEAVGSTLKRVSDSPHYAAILEGVISFLCKDLSAAEIKRVGMGLWDFAFSQEMKERNAGGSVSSAGLPGENASL
ncbi:hypothetical protein NA57DRAFT_77289 [Rhizodiscina lignyota]|uniref:Uncharacterized protein n=1 Tax=Rhizodiscina lignyota TaxID=1504668 RepID=A0A9P4IEG3_9PEZI|nr:hypothetical protein NA57DRAFT_77289 [Rhizodiscina lignyota]